MRSNRWLSVLAVLTALLALPLGAAQNGSDIDVTETPEDGGVGPGEAPEESTASGGLSTTVVLILVVLAVLVVALVVAMANRQ